MIIGITPYLYFNNTMLREFFKTENQPEKLLITCADGRIPVSQSFSD